MTVRTMPLIATVTIEIHGGIPRGSDLDEEWLQLVADGLRDAVESDVLGEGIDRASVTCTLSTDVGAEPQPEELAEASRLMAAALAEARAKDERHLAQTRVRGHGSYEQKHAASLALAAWHTVSWLRSQGVAS